MTTVEIQKLFAEKLSRPVGSPDEDLFEAGILDSMVLVELLLQLEQTFGLSISIADLDLDSIRTIRRIAELVDTQPVGEGASTQARR